METIITVVGLVVMTIILLVVFAKLLADNKNCTAIIVCTLALLSSLLFGLNLDLANRPNNEDVIRGNATYQEVIYVTDNDTIKTYNVIWKNKK